MMESLRSFKTIYQDGRFYFRLDIMETHKTRVNYKGIVFKGDFSR